jgi:hypothetical protein
MDRQLDSLTAPCLVIIGDKVTEEGELVDASQSDESASTTAGALVGVADGNIRHRAHASTAGNVRIFHTRNWCRSMLLFSCSAPTCCWQHPVPEVRGSFQCLHKQMGRLQVTTEQLAIMECIATVFHKSVPTRPVSEFALRINVRSEGQDTDKVPIPVSPCDPISRTSSVASC